MSESIDTEAIRAAAAEIINAATDYLADRHPTPPGRGETWPRESQIIVTCKHLLESLMPQVDSLRAENERLRLDQSLDAGEIVDVLTDAGIAPADYGGSIKSAIEALVGMDRITTANLAAAEAKLAAVAQLCDEASMEICHLDGMDSHMAVAVDDIRAALGPTGEEDEADE